MDRREAMLDAREDRLAVTQRSQDVRGSALRARADDLLTGNAGAVLRMRERIARSREQLDRSAERLDRHEADARRRTALATREQAIIDRQLVDSHQRLGEE